jgi:predicted AAA+ superfamily ATPase
VNVKELSRILNIDTRTIDKYLYVMKKSYIIAFIKPFWTNIRAELTKMPKSYFLDL